MPVWDAGLPQSPLIDGYDEAVPDTVLRSQPDTGPAKTRNRFTAGVRQVTWPFRMTTAQIALLDTFYLTTLDAGTTSFDHTDPRTGTTTSYKFRSAPRYIRSGLNWSVSLSLEILP